MKDAPNRTRRALLGLAPTMPAEVLPSARVALIGPACLCYTDVLCESCRDACSSRAIQWDRSYRSAPRPRVSPSACTGCGECVSVCPTGAISLPAGDA